MGRFQVTLIAVSLIALTVNTSPAQRGRSGNAARHGWLSDYAQAKAAARKSNKPLMVVFRCAP